MNRKKLEKTAYLFSAIGEIDDVLVAEAQLYQVQVKSRSPRWLLIAATLMLALALTLSTVLVAMIGNGKDSLPPDEIDPEQSEDGVTAFSDLDQLLLDRRDSASYTQLSSADSIPFLEKESYLVWQYADSDAYCISRALTDGEVEELIKGVQRSKQVGEESPALSCRVWVVSKDGTVFTPYLIPSAGNLEYAALFDYNAELIPSKELLSCISQILN